MIENKPLLIISKIIFALYMAVLLCITVIRPWNGSYHLFAGSLNTTVLVDYIDIFKNSIPVFIYLFGGNIIWFVPFGIYLTFFKRMPIGMTVLYGFLLSLFIEVMQFVLGAGISEINDLILNTAGAATGALIGPALRSRVFEKGSE